VRFRFREKVIDPSWEAYLVTHTIMLFDDVSKVFNCNKMTLFDIFIKLRQKCFLYRPLTIQI